MPREIADQFPDGGLIVRVIDREGREILCRSLPGQR
jgi:hypothetical protein